MIIYIVTHSYFNDRVKERFGVNFFIEKGNRVKEAYNLDDYSHIYAYAYGDSRGDKELLGLADKSFYKPFR